MFQAPKSETTYHGQSSQPRTTREWNELPKYVAAIGTTGDYLKRGTFLTAHSRNGRHISGQGTPPLYPTLPVSYCWMNTVTPHPHARSAAQGNQRHIVVIARHIQRLNFDGTKTAQIKNTSNVIKHYYFYINSNVFTLDNVYRKALLKLSRWQVECIITDLCIKNKAVGLINKTNYENINVDHSISFQMIIIT